MAELEILAGHDAGSKFDVDGGPVTIGRGEDCEIRLADSSVSRHHARLDCNEKGWRITDLGSQNGLLLDDQPATSFELTEKTRFAIGTVQVQFDPAVHSEDLYVSGDSPRGEPEEASTATAELETSTPDQMIEDVRRMADLYPRIEQEFGRAIIGQRAVLEELLVAIAAGGHCLMVGLPGLAKTLMVRTLANLLQLKFKRIQFTPDLMPSDILGTDVLEVNESTGQKSFRFIKGPIFTNILLGDEINRTPPKTQAALLESMQEHQVSISNHVFPLPAPFFVLATQNPIEQEGTYPLPEAQLDRFMFNITVDYPEEDEEEAIVMATTTSAPEQPGEIISARELLALQHHVRELPVSGHVVKYATRLARSSRPKNDHAPDFIRNYVYCGAGPRAAQYLILGAKARAVLHGRLNVSCDDIRHLALPVMRHRIYTNFTADSENVTTDDLIQKLLLSVPEPDARDY